MSWVKACGAVANFVLVTGSRGVALVSRMENEMGVKNGGPGTWRCMEPCHVPEDFLEIANLLERAKKLSPSKLRETVNSVNLRRWLTWTITHPELGPDKIHESRSMWGTFIGVGGSCIDGRGRRSIASMDGMGDQCVEGIAWDGIVTLPI